MSALAEDSTQPVSAGRWALRALVVLVLLAIALGGGWWLKSLSTKPAPRERQTARVSVLPDTPPPPPPPPPEKPPEPKEPPKATPQADTPKPADVPKPADAPLKMEGPAGDGPSAFQAGAVSKDYAGGPVGAASAAAPAAVRSQQRLYAANARQLLRDALERLYRGDTAGLVADFQIWVEGDGALKRFELRPTGNPQDDRDLRAALQQMAQDLRLPPPPAMPQPLRFRMSLREAG